MASWRDGKFTYIPKFTTPLLNSTSFIEGLAQLFIESVICCKLDIHSSLITKNKNNIELIFILTFLFFSCSCAALCCCWVLDCCFWMNHNIDLWLSISRFFSPFFHLNCIIIIILCSGRRIRMFILLGQHVFLSRWWKLFIFFLLVFWIFGDVLISHYCIIFLKLLYIWFYG